MVEAKLLRKKLKNGLIVDKWDLVTIIEKQQAEIERLTKENRDLGYYIDGWHKWKLQLQEFIK